MLDVRLLGKFQVSLDGQPVDIKSRPMQTLLAYLVLNAGISYRREQLAGLLWPDSDEKNGRLNLRQTLWRLGKAIGKEYFLTDKVSVGFNPQADYKLDVAVLQDGAAQQPPTAQLIAAVSVYTDILLPGFYDQWVILEQERLQSVYEDRMEMLLRQLVQEGRWRETRQWAERWIAQGRVPEAAYRALMIAHAGLGDQAAVIAAYRRCVNVLAEEVGVEPSSETETLFHRIISGQEQVAQKKLQKSQTEVTLPFQPTPFIGRSKDLKKLVTLVADPAVRLVTIAGPGGIGKTRLAIETARLQSDAFADGTYFVPLAYLDDPKLIATSIASALRFSSAARDHRDKEQQINQLLAQLRNKQLLLVLDNFEHLLEGLPLITSILQTALAVKILTTSRERLGLRGETVYALRSMQMPAQINNSTPGTIESHDALQLFVNCAQRAQPRFELNSDNLHSIIAICRLVDGLPLGIEMAAAWVGLLSLEEISAEIIASLDFLASHHRDSPDHQQSIRSVFESTWNRLSLIEQDVFQNLSVFRGGFTRQAAANVSGATLQILLSLVNKSLIQPDYLGRYHVHKLLQQFGSEKLGEAEAKEQARDLHLDYFLALARESEPHVKGSEQLTWLDLLEVEHGNLRAALEWSITRTGKGENGLLLAGSLMRFWEIRGYLHEGREHLSAVLSLPQVTKSTAARAKALYAAGQLAYLQSDYPATRLLLEESLCINRDLGPDSRLGLANALITLGDMETELGNYMLASSLMKEALAIMRELHNNRGIARALWQLGACAVRPGDYDAAEQYFTEALPILRQEADHSQTTIALSGLAEVALRRGNYGRAAALEAESLALRREIGETWGIAVSTANFAWIALRRGDLRQAEALLGESLALRHEIGDIGGIAWCLEKLAEIALAKGQQVSKTDQDEQYQRATRLFGAAEALRAPVSSAIDQVDQPEHERQVAFLGSQLDQASFTAAWGEGRTMTLEQALVYASLPKLDNIA